MPLLKTESYTITDIYALDDGERAELIDGKIYNMAPPTRIHQKLSSELHTVIHNYIKKKGGKSHSTDSMQEIPACCLPPVCWILLCLM